MYLDINLSPNLMLILHHEDQIDSRGAQLMPHVSLENQFEYLLFKLWWEFIFANNFSCLSDNGNGVLDDDLDNLVASSVSII